MTYRDIRPRLETGDLAFFSSDTGMAAVLRAFGQTWTHVGVVYKIHADDLLLLWESTPPGSAEDIRSGRATNGIKLSILSQRVAEYPRVGFRRLVNPLTTEGRARFALLRDELEGTPYEDKLTDLVLAALDPLDPLLSMVDRRDALHAMFCSEAVAHYGIKLGKLTPNKPSWLWTPDELARVGAWEPMEEIET